MGRAASEPEAGTMKQRPETTTEHTTSRWMRSLRSIRRRLVPELVSAAGAGLRGAGQLPLRPVLHGEPATIAKQNYRIRRKNHGNCIPSLVSSYPRKRSPSRVSE
jgi:hypothetical protein